MPRKPARRPRTTRTIQKSDRSTAPPRGKRHFYQCLMCGAAPIDPMYGLGLESWCPHCREPEGIDYREGQLPDPVLYGRWRQRQEEKASAPELDQKGNDPFSHLQLSNGVTTMKQSKTHTGTYCCPACCIEFNLVAEESLKCDRCSGPIIKGTLEDLWEDDEDQE